MPQVRSVIWRVLPAMVTDDLRVEDVVVGQVRLAGDEVTFSDTRILAPGSEYTTCGVDFFTVGWSNAGSVQVEISCPAGKLNVFVYGVRVKW